MFLIINWKLEKIIIFHFYQHFHYSFEFKFNKKLKKKNYKNYEHLIIIDTLIYYKYFY